jgi:hypothetical protein
MYQQDSQNHNDEWTLRLRLERCRNHYRWQAIGAVVRPIVADAAKSFQKSFICLISLGASGDPLIPVLAKPRDWGE